VNHVPRVFAMVLAAGAGTRMGTPKTRLMLDDRSLLAHHAERLREVGCTSVTLVVRPEEVRRAPRHALVVSVQTRDQAESFTRGLSALAGVRGDLTMDDIILITPVDVLPPRLSTLEELIATARSARDIDAVTPRHRGWSGQPVLVRFGIVAQYLDSRAAPQPLRDVVRRSRRLRVDVDDEAVLSDLDTPDDVELASGELDLWIQTARGSRHTPSAK
jgi:CTP:molybdopterin cytidylyltransferase MocA